MSNHSLSRRHVLGLLGAGAMAAATGGLAGCARTGSGTRPAGDADGTAGALLVQPPELRSAGGVLAVELVAAPARLPWGSGTRYALTYNGTSPGPTLRVRPGDVLTITLRNGLDRPTNLHTHGLHVSPEGASDDVFVMVEPGARRTYEYRIPSDHPSGTFWYHPHHHGEVAAQLAGGLAGLLVVEDDLDRALTGPTERLLVLTDPRIGTDASVLGATIAERQRGREGDVVLVNGGLRPVVDAPGGGVERWRILNASPSRYNRLVVDGASVSQIATDGGRLARPEPVTEVLLTPGQRVELLVRLPRTGTAVLRAAAVDRGGMGGMGGMGMGGGMGGATSPAAELLTVRIGAGTGASFTAPDALRAIDAIERLHVDAKRTVTLGAMGMGGGTFVIDGRSFAAERTDVRAAIGTTEEWTLVNASMMDHPFHLHVWPFRVVSRSDGSPDPGWRDTVNVPAGGRVVIRIPFTDTPGRTVYHCHILDHEDLGMMGVIEVR